MIRRPHSLALAGLVALALAAPRARADNGPPEQGPGPAPAAPVPEGEPPASPLPQSGAGLLAAEGGLRYTFPNSFVNGVKVTSHPVSPAAILPFMYQVDRHWAILLEVGYSQDRFDVMGVGGASTLGGLFAQTATIQLGAEWTPDFGWYRVQPYLGGGFGYYLTSLTPGEWATTQSVPSESNTTGIFAALGCRIALTSRIGLVVEDRYAFASTGVGDLGSISVGGNTAALGLYVVWKE